MKLRVRRHFALIATIGALALAGAGAAVARDGMAAPGTAAADVPATGLLAAEAPGAPTGGLLTSPVPGPAAGSGDASTGAVGAPATGISAAPAGQAQQLPAGAQAGLVPVAPVEPSAAEPGPVVPAAPAVAEPVAVAPAAPGVAEPAATPVVPGAAPAPTGMAGHAAQVPPGGTAPVPPVGTVPSVSTPPVVIGPVDTPPAVIPPLVLPPVVTPVPDTAAERYGWGAPLPESDEFDYQGGPDPAKWDTIDGCWAGHAGNGRRCGDRSTVDGEKLIQTGTEGGDTGWLASKLNQQYGRWEARVRSSNTGDSGNEYHPLLIVWPESDAWPQDGEYDFLENQAPGEDCANAFIHYPHPAGPVQQEFLEEDDCGAPLSEWHNIAFEWTPDHVRGYIDGKEWYTLQGGAGEGGREAIQAMPSGHLTIQFDNFYGGGMRAANYEIDWVRMYPLEPIPLPADAAPAADTPAAGGAPAAGTAPSAGPTAGVPATSPATGARVPEPAASPAVGAQATDPAAIPPAPAPAATAPATGPTATGPTATGPAATGPTAPVPPAPTAGSIPGAVTAAPATAP